MLRGTEQAVQRAARLHNDKDPDSHSLSYYSMTTRQWSVALCLECSGSALLLHRKGLTGWLFVDE